MRECHTNFCTNAYAIDHIAVWVRISDLPIEYYDHMVLTFVGTRIWKMIKADKTILSRDRGKYTCMRVQVNLKQPRLAMFSIKGKHYKVEYEGFISCVLYVEYFGMKLLDV